jgi:hypothetical protein
LVTVDPIVGEKEELPIHYREPGIIPGVKGASAAAVDILHEVGAARSAVAGPQLAAVDMVIGRMWNGFSAS